MRETKYQKYLVELLQDIFPGCLVIRNDPLYIQGIPDILVLYEDRWAMLEVKPSYRASVRPNQEYYVNLLNNMSYAAIIFPENEEEVLDELQRAFRSRRSARIPQRQ